MIDVKATRSGYHERIGRIALFDVFSAADKKQKKDQKGNEIDHYGLLMMTMLFFFECMLTREKKSGATELAAYLRELTHGYYELLDEDYQDLARQMIGLLRPIGGKRNQKDFLNFETGEKDFVEFSYLKVSGWDKEKNHQYYLLDEQGLELIFATKEYYNEFQISISQLILRKQLEKGEFVGALRQIDEMRISVLGIRDRMASVKHEIQRNIVSDEVYERYKKTVEDINARLQREHEEFEEIANFVQDTRKLYERDYKHNQKENTAYQIIIRIDNELMDVHHMHSNLLNESISLKSNALEAARDSMYYVSLVSFNFQQEIVGRALGEPIPYMETQLMLKPFLGMSRKRLWTPLAMFAKQRIQKKELDIDPIGFLEIGNYRSKEELKIRKRYYRILFANLLKCMDKEAVFSEMIDKMPLELADKKELYEMLVLLHHLSPLDIREIREQREHIFSEAFEVIPQSYNFLEVEEIKGKYLQREQIAISDMSIRLMVKGENENDR